MDDPAIAQVFAWCALAFAVFMSYLWVDPKLRASARWGRSRLGAPLSKRAGNGLTLAAFALIGVASYVDHTRSRGQ